jgi:hypothetical protein
MIKPKLNKAISVYDFQNFYWLKAELVSFCRANGINASGSKSEIAGKIEQYLATGKISSSSVKPVITSNFDWKNAELNLNTKLTDNYKNTENVRAFMLLHIGMHFKFNTEFMSWTKANVGKTLMEAVTEWKRIFKNKKEKKTKTEISPQFEYNIFIRDYFANNPKMTLKDAIISWKIKTGSVKK